MPQKTKLELTWIGKDIRPRLEPRILLEDPEKSYHANEKVSEKDIFDNRLIFGDNLLALKALEQEFTGMVKCIFIDPPYNTGSAFEHFDDGLEHSIWLSLMRDRVELLHTLLSPNGSIWIAIDDNESHYLKIVCDEVFGRSNFVASVIWRKNYSPKSSSKTISVDHDYLLVFAKDISRWTPNPMPRSDKQDSAYKNPDHDSRGQWKPSDLSARNPYSLGRYAVRCPSGRVIDGPPGGRYWSISEERLHELDRDGRIWWGKNGDSVPQLKRFLSDVKQGVVPQTYWPYEEVGHTQDAKKEVLTLFGEDAFSTPKPEKLLKRVLDIASNPGDLVLDSFAGSGTTGAVAHKMGRRWIMVELGDHIHSHIIPRMVKVVNGSDPGGITESVKWRGGGGFRYYHLAPTLIEKDRFGNPVINPKYNAAMLAEAMCKIMGYQYAPSGHVFWQHGRATENDYLYVTTQTLTHEQLAQLSDEVGEGRSLHICCSAFRGKPAMFSNLTVEKIPSSVLNRCEWGKDDYSLQVANLPQARGPEPKPQMALFATEPAAE